MRESIIFYRSYYEAIKELSPEEQLKIYEAIFEYGFFNNEIKTTGVEKVVFNLIKPTLNSSASRYSASVENGRKGGAPKGNTNAKKQPKNNLENNLEQPKNNLNYNYTYNDTYNDTLNENENVAVAVAYNEEELLSPTTATNVFDFYLKNINPMPTIHEIDQLKDYQKDMADDLICYAIEIAVENKKRNLAYIKGILNSWSSKGISTLAEAKEEKKSFEGGTTDKEQEEIYKRFLAKGDG